jgi:hypothetical protein
MKEQLPPRLPVPSSPTVGPNHNVVAKGGPTPERLVDRGKQIFGSKELQLPPTDASPTKQRYKLAGGA